MSTTHDSLPGTTQGGMGPAVRVAVAAAVSLIINLVIYAIARALGADMIVPESPGSDVTERLEPLPVAVASVLPVLLAAIVALGLRRWAAEHAGRAFTVLVILGLLVSFVPFATEDFSTGTTIALAFMHPTVAIVVYFFLRPILVERSD